MLRKSKKGVLFTLISVFVIVLLSACSGETQTGGNNDEQKTIKLLTPIFEGSDGKEALEGTIIPAFNEKYPNVNVEVEYTTYAKLNEKLTTAMVGGTMPDVLMMGVGWVEGFAKENQLKGLSEFGENIETLSDTFNEKVLQAGVYEGELYALPLMLDTRFGLYRKDLFKEAGLDPEQPPTNWGELREYAIKLTQRDESGDLEVAGLDMLAHDYRQIWLPFLWQNGGDLWNEDRTEPALNNEKGVEALEFFTDLVIKDKVTDIGFETGTDATLLGSGMAAMMLGHNNMYSNIAEQNPDVLDEIGFFLIEEEKPAFFYGGTLVTISESTEQPEEAYAFLQHLVDKEAALLANEQRGNVPARYDLLDSDYVQNNKAIKFAMENLEFAMPEGGIPAWLEVRSKLTEEIEQALYGEKTPKEALDEVANHAKAAMDR